MRARGSDAYVEAVNAAVVCQGVRDGIMESKNCRAIRTPLSVLRVMGVAVVFVLSLAVPLTSAARAATWEVSIVNYAFQPDAISIGPGDTVRWTNTGDVTHSVVSDAGSPEPFGSGPLAPGERWSYKFNNPGIFMYHCVPHTFMHGTVHVGGVIPEFSSLAITTIGLLVLVVGITTIGRKR